MSQLPARRPKPRTFLARRMVRLAEKWQDRRLVSVAYPPPASPARYGHGRLPHAELLQILRGSEEAYRRSLETMAGYREDLQRIPVLPSPDAEPTWMNRWLPALDAAALYGFIRSRAPARYVEVGSGMSTLFARRAIADGDLATQITSIDPEPREEVEAQCDHTVRAPLETADLSVFDEVTEGDVVFMDGSHQVFANSDATVFVLDVLPRLPSGVLVAVHDVLLPDDYLPEWSGYHWAEQYLIAAYLLARGSQIQLELAAYYVTRYSELGLLDPLWDALGLGEAERRGFALWFSTTNR